VETDGGKMRKDGGKKQLGDKSRMKKIGGMMGEDRNEKKRTGAKRNGIQVNGWAYKTMNCKTVGNKLL
jgi:hypothetical protein